MWGRGVYRTFKIAGQFCERQSYFQIYAESNVHSDILFSIHIPYLSKICFDLSKVTVMVALPNVIYDDLAPESFFKFALYSSSDILCPKAELVD